MTWFYCRILRAWRRQRILLLSIPVISPALRRIAKLLAEGPLGTLAAGMAEVYWNAFATIVMQMPSAIASAGKATRPKISTRRSAGTEFVDGVERGSSGFAAISLSPIEWPLS